MATKFEIFSFYSVTISPESSLALGPGWRLGFLGVLHMEVFTQRLEDEYSASVIVTPPSVPYKLKIRDTAKKYLDIIDDDNFITVSNPNDWPLFKDIEEYYEPIGKLYETFLRKRAFVKYRVFILAVYIFKSIL